MKVTLEGSPPLSDYYAQISLGCRGGVERKSDPQMVSEAEFDLWRRTSFGKINIQGCSLRLEQAVDSKGAT